MVALAREVLPCWRVSHLKDQIRIIQQVGLGTLGKFSSLHWGGDYSVLLECCWSLVHFCELNMKFSYYQWYTVYTASRKSINLVQFCSVLKEKCYFLCLVTSGSDSVACQNS